MLKESVFINQSAIFKELKLLAREARYHSFNILLRARSGYGKTTLAKIFLSDLEKLWGYEACQYEPGEERFSPLYRVHFYDECHLIKNPEFLYRYMDSGRYIFVFASNLSGSLKEPLINRTIQFYFEDYTEEHIKLILESKLPYLSKPNIEFLSDKCRLNPRIATKIAERLNFALKKQNPSPEMLKKILTSMGIYDKGLTRQDLKYYQCLKIHSPASLQLISSITGLDKETIINEIEPHLIKLGLIKITSRGRILIENSLP